MKIIVFVFSICFVFLHHKIYTDENKVNVVVRPMNEEESFDFLTYLIKRMPWFNENGYKISLPHHPEFEKTYQDPEIFDNNKSYFKEIFFNQIYDLSDFDVVLKEAPFLEEKIIDVLKKLEILKKNWSFQLKEKHEIIFTLYGPGGNYFYDNEIAKPIIRITNKEGIIDRWSLYKTIVHEIVHIGIDEDIINKYKLNHWEKERLVDLICLTFLQNLLVDYRFQNILKTDIDQYVDEEAILYNLPKAVENFILDYPR